MYTFDRARNETLMAAALIDEELGRAYHYYGQGAFEMTPEQAAAMNGLIRAAAQAYKAFK